MQNKLHPYWSRKLTLNERVYRANEELSTPFAIQYIIEGEGFLDPIEIQSKLNKLVSFIPALKLKQVGKRWTFNGSNPALIVHKTTFQKDWNAPLFKASIASGTCCEFHLFPSNQSTLVFRVLHSAMDGIGGLIVLKNLFTLLNNESISEIPDHLDDFETRDQLKAKPEKKRKQYRFEWKSLDPSQLLELPVQFNTELIRLPKRTEMTLAKVAKWFMNQTGDTAQFLIPVNIRRHNIPNESVSNLSLPIYLKTQVNESINDIHSNLLREIVANNELARDPIELIAKRIPYWMLKKGISQIVKKAVRTNLFPMSGFISDFGTIKLNQYSTTSFKAEDIYSLPVFTGAAPFCVTISNHENGTRLAFSVPIEYNIEKLKKSLAEELSVVKKSLKQHISPAYKHTKEVVQIWAETLKYPDSDIDLDTSFINLGGDSLSLLILINKVGEKFATEEQSDFMMRVLKYGVDLSPNTMLEILKKYE